MAKVTQKDIADSLNLSRVTITKALKDDPDIAVETRDKIKKKAKELGYIPDLVGRNLAANKTYTIGIVLPKIAHSFFSFSLEYMYMAAKKKGYNITPMISFEDTDNEINNIETLLSMRVDGIIIDIATNTTDYSIFDTIKSRGTGLVFFDRFPNELNENAVVCNDFAVARQATELAIKKGAKKIVHFSGPQHINIGRERLRGFREALQEHDISLNESSIVGSGFTKKSGYEAFKKFISDGNETDFIIAVNDSCAHGIYKAADELGIKIPNDIGIIGFGDLEISHLLDPPLTSIKMPLKEMAENAVDLLIEQIEQGESQNNKKSKVIYHQGILDERDSHNIGAHV